jgi:hypothetical protein
LTWPDLYNNTLAALRQIPTGATVPQYLADDLLALLTRVYVQGLGEPPWLDLQQLIHEFQRLRVPIPPAYEFQWINRLQYSQAWADLQFIIFQLSQGQVAAVQQLLTARYFKPAGGPAAQNAANSRALLGYLLSALIQVAPWPPETTTVLQGLLTSVTE